MLRGVSRGASGTLSAGPHRALHDAMASGPACVTIPVCSQSSEQL